jgi:hypothetical protein
MHTEKEITEFWRDAEWWCARTGCSEDDVLKRFPSYRGTKTGAHPHQALANVVSMPAPLSDRKRAAAGDYDDAA